MKLAWSSALLLPLVLLPATVTEEQSTCSNGFAGFEEAGACCAIECGGCGGRGCSGDCCVGNIVDSGIKCIESEMAPCILADVSAGCSEKWKEGAAGADVVLLMGQSNMSGRGIGYDDDLDGPNDDRIEQWTRENTITTAFERLEHADFEKTGWNDRVGMGTAFGRAYAENLPSERSVLLVPTAYGGSQLVNGPWSIGGELFEDAVTRLADALASNEEDGNCVGAILWHQGENDASASVDEATYASTWTAMISDLRSRVSAAAEAPVVLGEFADAAVENNPDWYAPVLAAIRGIPDAVPWTAVASAAGLESNDNENDPLHFNAEAMREYGQRYYDVLGEAIGIE
eukprot:g7407.t1